MDVGEMPVMPPRLMGVCLMGGGLALIAVPVGRPASRVEQWQLGCRLALIAVQGVFGPVGRLASRVVQWQLGQYGMALHVAGGLALMVAAQSLQVKRRVVWHPGWWHRLSLQVKQQRRCHSGDSSGEMGWVCILQVVWHRGQWRRPGLQVEQQRRCQSGDSSGEMGRVYVLVWHQGLLMRWSTFWKA